MSISYAQHIKSIESGYWQDWLNQRLINSRQKHWPSSPLNASLAEMKQNQSVTRCGWAGSEDYYVRYHDTEWGVPVHDDRLLFEFLILEGAQAGLSWSTILKKREAYQHAFDSFEPEKVARYGEKKIASLLANPGIVRNRLKVHSAVTNAKAFLSIQQEFGSFDAYQWRFVDGRPIVNRWTSLKQVPAKTKVSDAFSKDLLQRGFKFVGSTIVYAHMQAIGMVNDHIVDCFRHAEVSNHGNGRFVP